LQHILIIQTAFIGDVVLALPIAQRLRAVYPQAEIHFAVRKGNEGLLANHPAIDHIHIWNKQQHKTRNLLALIRDLRKVKFDLVINVQRYFSTGFITACLRADVKVGFSANPLSALYTRKHLHYVGRANDETYPHEVDRNLSLLTGFANTTRELPRLYPSAKDHERALVASGGGKYYVVAPASVWFTKQWPESKWAELLQLLPADRQVFLVGARGDHALCASLAATRAGVTNLAGELSFLETAALMQKAARTFANDSAPLHFATAVGCPTTAVFLNTVPQFGFGPLAPGSTVAEVSGLPCRPCSLHGLKTCPQGHFKCALELAPATVAAHG